MNNAANSIKKQRLIKFLLIIAFISLCCLRFEAFRLTENARKEFIAKQNEARNIILEKADYLFRGYFYDEALEILFSNEDLINNEIIELSQKIEDEKNNLVLYEDLVQHIFFHSLILYPEHLFPDITKTGGLYGSGFVFLREAQRMLPQLMERGYVLYNINDVFGKDENDVMRRKEIYLPPGKKPLIISMDDPSYHYGVGFANRIILDENGELAAEVITPEGETIIRYDGDIQLVINDFVKENPQFSYRGTKGIIATTGYLGFLGYKLDTEESKRQAKAIADKFKETGWLFASHSFGHNLDYFYNYNSIPENIAYDLWEWRRDIEPIVGKTNIFVAPFGNIVPAPSMRLILNYGFDIYCDVNLKQITVVYERYALMSRIEMGGYVFQHIKEHLDELFFDVDSVKDAKRPVQKGYGD